MSRRETYPCASLESVVKVLSTIKSNALQRSAILELGVTQDELRLAEVLDFVKRIGETEKRWQATFQGERLLSFSSDRQRILLFQALVRDNGVLPPYFKRVLEERRLHNRKLSTKELCEELGIKDLWSADILNEWCRHLGISEGETKTEVYISSEKVALIKREAFGAAFQQEYDRLSGSSGLVPVARLRRELKNSGILGSQDDFDELLNELSGSEQNRDRITYHPAPSGLVGVGLKGMAGYELVSIRGELSF